MKRTKLSAGAVVLRRHDAGRDARGRATQGVVADDRWQCLVLRAYRNWDFPKGLVESGEEPLEAALREVREETGLRDLALPWGDVWRETEPYAGGKVARYYVAESPSGTVVLPVNPELGRPEHHEFRWLELDAAARLLPPRLQQVLLWAAQTAAGSFR